MDAVSVTTITWSRDAVSDFTSYPMSSRAALVTNANVHRQTSNLPTELLARIFLMVRNEAGRAPDGAVLSNWIQVSWVCQRWRRIATTTPALWANIYLGRDLENVSWLRVFLERAKRMPLDITLLEDIQYYGEEAFDLLVRSVGSFRYLEFQAIAPRGKEKSLVPYLPHMHSLEELNLGNVNADLEPLSSALADLGLTRKHCPRLYRLTLWDAFFPWTSSIYCSLRELKLILIAPLPPAHTLFRILQSCPDLEIMEWTNILQDEPFFIPTDGAAQLTPVSLPHLQQILIDDSYTRAQLLCEYIVVPPTCDIIVYPRCDGWLTAASPRQLIFSTVIPVSTHIQMSLDKASSFSLAAGIGRRTGWVNLESPTSSSINVIERGHPIRSSLDFATWRDLLDPFTPTDGRESPVTSFSLEYSDLRTMSPMMWRTGLARFPRLEELIVGAYKSKPLLVVSGTSDTPCEIFKNIFAALSGGPDPQDNGKEAEPCGTRLRRVVWMGMLIDGATLLALQHMLEMRAARGFPLKELAFENCYCAEDTSPATVLSLLALHVEVKI